MIFQVKGLGVLRIKFLIIYWYLSGIIRQALKAYWRVKGDSHPQNAAGKKGGQGVSPAGFSCRNQHPKKLGSCQMHFKFPTL